MKKKKQNTFFTEDIYETEIALGVNEDVLKRIYNSKITADSRLPIEFFFVSNNVDNVLNLQKHLKENFADYKQLKVQPYENLYELSGLTSSIQMSLDLINKWNKLMWDLGYDFDCKLDGWQVEH
jgi:hypothetical protein